MSVCLCNWWFQGVHRGRCAQISDASEVTTALVGRSTAAGRGNSAPEVKAARPPEATTATRRDLDAAGNDDRVVSAFLSSSVAANTEVSRERRADNEVGSDPRLENTVLGVKLVWTAPQYRRQKVAHRLVDAARKSIVFGLVVPVQSMAFSQPTESGFAFARAYCRSKRVLAYA